MRLTVYKKMMLGFGVIIVIVVISSAYLVLELSAVSEKTRTILEAKVASQKIARQIKGLVQDEISYAQKYKIANDPTYLSLFSETGRQVDKHLTRLMATRSSGPEKELIQGILSSHGTFIQGVGSLDRKFEQEKMEGIITALDRLIRESQSGIGEEMARIESISAQSVKVALLLIAGSLFAAFSAAFIIARTITKPIGELIRGTRQIALGRFDPVRVSSKDEMALLARAVNDMSDRLKAVNTQRAQMMQQISHELKTPLQAVQSAHDILMASGKMDKDQVRLLEIIERAVDKMSLFSRQYMDLAKIESGAVAYDLRPKDLMDIVKPVVEDATIIAESKQIRLELESRPAPRIMADEEKAAIIISNLITNAIKYTQKNGHIQVSVGPKGLGAFIRVQDSGIGISPKDLPNVFTRFYQAGTAKEARKNGSGVGLAIVKAYCQGHGGQVRVQSRPGQGSTFQVDFPAPSDSRPDMENHFKVS